MVKTTKDSGLLKFTLTEAWDRRRITSEKILARFQRFVDLGNAGHSPTEVMKAMRLTGSSFNMVLCEVRKAAREGYTLEEYIEARRPCRAGAKVVASANGSGKRKTGK